MLWIKKWLQSDLNSDNICTLQPEFPTSGFVFAARGHQRLSPLLHSVLKLTEMRLGFYVCIIILFFLNIFMSKSIISTFILTLRMINPPLNFWQLKEGQIQLRPENFFVKLVPTVANGILWRAAGDKTGGNLIKALYNKIITITAPCRRRSHSQRCKFKLASCHCDIKPLTCNTY